MPQTAILYAARQLKRFYFRIVLTVTKRIKVLPNTVEKTLISTEK